jgi:hypothetical protein
MQFAENARVEISVQVILSVEEKGSCLESRYQLIY